MAVTICKKDLELRLEPIYRTYIGYKLLFSLHHLIHVISLICLNTLLPVGLLSHHHWHSLILARCFNEICEYFFSNHTVKIWNQLPHDSDFTSIISVCNYFIVITVYTRHRIVRAK